MLPDIDKHLVVDIADFHCLCHIHLKATTKWIADGGSRTP